MNKLDRQYFGDAGSLDAVSYFQFLVKEGYRLSLIGAEQLEKLQYQLAELLTDRFNRWTAGQSSSVPVETGQRIQQSAFYTIGCYLKSLPDAECALDALKDSSMQDLFLKGKARLEELRKEAETLLDTVQGNCLSTDHYAYNDTIRTELPIFFSDYDMDYEAHETPACIDYPLCCDKMNLTGVDYIVSYLRKLRLENEFCAYFSNEAIHSLLRGYDRQYKELLVNICELVLTNAVGCLLLGRKEPGLDISEYDRLYLQSELGPLPKETVIELVDDAISRLCNMLPVSDPKLANYLRLSAGNLKSRLHHALETGGLEHLFLSPVEESAETPVLFEDKEKLDDDSFRRFADDIRECRFVSDKLALLRGMSPGVGDLTGLLEGACFFGEEYQDVFSSLDEIQLALLVKELPLDPADYSFLEEESSAEWQISLHAFLMQIDPVRRSAIFAISDRLVSDSDSL